MGKPAIAFLSSIIISSTWLTKLQNEHAKFPNKRAMFIHFHSDSSAFEDLVSGHQKRICEHSRPLKTRAQETSNPT